MPNGQGSFAIAALISSAVGTLIVTVLPGEGLGEDVVDWGGSPGAPDVGFESDPGSPTETPASQPTMLTIVDKTRP